MHARQLFMIAADVEISKTLYAKNDLDTRTLLAVQLRPFHFDLFALTISLNRCMNDQLA